MPDIYAPDKPSKDPQLELVYELVPDPDESTGFDPYNTGGIDTSKTAD